MKIAHISDIHIRLASRHKEYKEVFDNLIQSLQENEPDLIVNTGDTFHSKVHLSPEAFDGAKYLYDKLVEVAPNVVIAGNHDMNLSGTHRLDAISPFVDLFNSDKEVDKQITYLKDSGVFDYGLDIRFFLYPMIGNEMPDISKAQVDRINIGLYHGVVGGAKLDNEYQFKKEDQKINIPHKKLDAVLLGDIHKYQMLKDNMGYASSLIQQNWGENPDTHGYIMWEFDPEKVTNKFIGAEFIPVENIRGLYKVSYENGKVISNYKKVPPLATIKVIYDSDVVKEDVQRAVKEKYNIDNILLEEKGIELDGQTIDVKEDIMNLHNYENQKQVVSDYFGDDEHREDILKLNEKLFEQNRSKFHTDSKRLLWSPQYIEFDNIFVYGEDNKFVFSDKNGIIGLFSPNRSGKSSFLDTIQFAVYGETAHTSTYDDIINKDSKEYRTFITLTVSNRHFSIERTGKKTGSGWTNSLEVCEYDSNGNTISEEGDMREAKNIIEAHFGGAKNYEKTSYIYQDNDERFLNLTPAKRKDWLYDNLGLQVFEVLHESAKEESKDLRNKINYLEDKDIKKTIDQNILTKSDYNDKIEIAQEKLDKVEKQVSEYNDKIESLKESKKAVDDSLEDKSSEIESVKNGIAEDTEKVEKLEGIDEDQIKDEVRSSYEEKEEELNTKRDRLESSRGNDLSEKKQKEKKLEKLAKEGKHLKSLMVKEKETMTKIKRAYVDSPVDLEDVEKKLANSKSEMQELEVYKYKVGDLKEKIEKYEEESSVLTEDKRFKNEDLCQTCPLLSTAFEKRDKIPSLVDHLKMAESKVEDYELLHDEVDTLEKIVKEYKEDQADYKASKKELKRLNDLREDKLEQYKSVQEDIKVLDEKRSEIIDSKVENIDKELTSLKESFEKDVESRKKEIESEIKIRQSEIEVKKGKLDQLTSLQESYEENLKNITHNKTIDEEIKSIVSDRDEINEDVVSLQDEVIELKSDKKSIENRIKDLKEEYEELKKLKGDYVVYEKYIKGTHKNKIPLQVISKMLNVVQHEVNMVLDQITNFKLKLFVENDNVICNIVDQRNEREANRLSGMERFVSNLAFRIAISQIGNMPVSNILIVDEGFSAIDSSSSQELPELFRYLKRKFDHIFVVSHHESMRDIVDYNVEIDTSKTKSRIYED